MSEDKEEKSNISVNFTGGDISGQIAFGGNIRQSQGAPARKEQGDGLPDPEERPEQVRLRDALRDQFSEGELRNLTFDLGLDYELLDGANKGDKALEIVLYFTRRDRLPRLKERLRQLRPELEL